MLKFLGGFIVGNAIGVLIVLYINIRNYERKHKNG